MMKFFFSLGDFLTCLVPFRALRENLRVVQLYDFRRKFDALKRKFPEMNFKNIRMVRGGWNIGFIVDNKCVFKIRKLQDSSPTIDRIIREKRITDAFAHISTVQIPRISVVEAGGFTFYKYDFIPGKNLNKMPFNRIQNNCPKLGKQLAEFIFAVHNSNPKDICDLKTDSGDGWNHNDICNNIIINPKTMDVVGLIDWEYAGFGYLETEFRNTTCFSRLMRKSDIILEVMLHYYALLDQKASTKKTTAKTK